MIEIINIHKSFGKESALDGVSFKAPNHHVTGLLGPNGAGKTTLLRILYGMLLPSKGMASIDGQDIRSHAEIRKNIGALPHAHGLYARLTAREHIEYFGQLHGLESKILAERIDTLVKLLDMHDIIDRRTAGFSEGQSVKVAVARAIVHNPKNILLDEPTAGLDVISTRKMRSFIRAQRDEGRCVLFSSHIMQEVSELCDNIVIISHGKVVAYGTADDLRSQTSCDNLEDAFVKIIGTNEGLQ